MLSCKESGVPVSKPSTFVRYFSDGNPNSAVDVLETSDHGFMIMSYSKPSDNSRPGRINLIKTTSSGNTVKESTIESKTLSDLIPSNIVAIKNGVDDTGYLIIGTSQNRSYGSRLFIARVDLTGALLSPTDSVSYYIKSGDGHQYNHGAGIHGVYLKGRGVAQTSNATKDFFVVAQGFKTDLVTASDTSIYFAQIDGTSLDTVFTHKFLANTVDLATRLYLNHDEAIPANNETHLFWGATRLDDKGSHLYFLRSSYDSEPQGVDFAQTHPNDNPDSYVMNDLCPYGSGYYGLVGTHLDPVSGKYDAIIYINADPSNAGIQLDKASFPLSNPTSQQGASICTTSGGFVLLYTEAQDAGGTNTDYVLTKIDINGNAIKGWPKKFGGKYLDIGKRVLQSSDGGYVVLGTTVLANVETVFFMKTDGGGNIQ